ncbi:14784_t:CDS:2 [Dentiscutata erythropus]|uniref:14784_t:CDS:1 n=1 Tax=Dentiscutata erythropus TaxID=1348616 RepID=A0A9N9FY12_9GLOM|nr:14784_t:CDS:2 [Dentiscutata erythropus]
MVSTNATITQLCIIMNTISLISSVASCVTFGFIRTYYPKLADRVSFRLSFAALFCDIGYSGHHLLFFCWDATPGFLCVYAGLQLGTYLCTTKNTCIDIGMKLSNCWYLATNPKNKIIWQWVTLFSWIDASILYCAIVIIMVIRKLKFVAEKFDSSDYSLTTRLSSHPPLIDKYMISSVVRRVMWYPVLPVAQIFGSLAETYHYVNHVTPYSLMLISYRLLSALVFSQDIAVTRTFQAIKLQWWISNVNYYESHYPHRSHNKAITDNPSRLISSEPLSSINSFVGNDDSNQDIILDNKNDDLVLPKPVHLKDSNQYSSSISSEPLIGSSQSYQTNNTDVIDILNCAVEDEGRIDVMKIIGEPTKRISEEHTRMFGSDVESFKETEIMLRKL